MRSSLVLLQPPSAGSFRGTVKFQIIAIVEVISHACLGLSYLFPRLLNFLPGPNMHPYKPTNSRYISSQQAQQAAHALASALANPYAHSSNTQQQYPFGPNFSYSSHYAQAYLQGSSSTPLTTPEGYTLSSTYAPTPHAQTGRGGLGQPGQRGGRGTSRRGAFFSAGSNMGGWYEPGNHKCTYELCTFMGSKKSVETHMMDRHLIYPPGWDNRKRKPDWDADPSLNTGSVVIFRIRNHTS